MSLIQKIVLIIHIISGFTALSSGLVPMLVKKGTRTHVISGYIFVFGMYGVSLTSTLMFIVKPYNPFLLFLLFIGIFSFYLTYTGISAIKHNKAQYKIKIMDWVAVGTILIAGIAMVSFSIYYLLQLDYVFAILYGVFGYLSLSLFFGDYKSFMKWRVSSPEKMAWFYNHMSRILGSYIATFTAFCVVNVHFLPPLIVWSLPGLIGGIGITIWIRKYKKKFETVSLS